MATSQRLRQMVGHLEASMILTRFISYKYIESTALECESDVKCEITELRRTVGMRGQL